MSVRRRPLIASGMMLVVVPVSVVGQIPDKIHHIGFLGARSRSTPANPDAQYDAWLRAMRDLGYVEGKNLVIEWRFADNKFERLSALAVELSAMKLDVIVTHALPPTLALQKATSTTPIVFVAMVDPVGNRVVPNLAHPGGNVTGLSLMAADISAKRLELLHEMIPSLNDVVVLVNPLTTAHPAMFRSTEESAIKLGIKVTSVEARTPGEIENAFASLATKRPVGIIIPDDGFYVGQMRKLSELALKHRIPSMVPYREMVEVGALVCYGQSVVDYYRKSTVLVDKILRGAKPADIPIEQPTKFDFVINLKTAKALGITIPQLFLLRADEVIQ